jgi:hypothetical protein
MAYYRDMESDEHEISMQAWISGSYTSHRVRGDWNWKVNAKGIATHPCKLLRILHPGLSMCKQQELTI